MDEYDGSDDDTYDDLDASGLEAAARDPFDELEQLDRAEYDD